MISIWRIEETACDFASARALYIILMKFRGGSTNNWRIKYDEKRDLYLIERRVRRG